MENNYNMTEQHDSMFEYAKKAKHYIDKRNSVQTSWHGNWLVNAYFGPTPTSDPEGNVVAQLEYTACAITSDERSGVKPNVSNHGMQICFDEQSIVWVSAENMDDITRKLTDIFPGFEWEKEENIDVAKT
jgi:hypothetical protein